MLDSLLSLHLAQIARLRQAGADRCADALQAAVADWRAEIDGSGANPINLPKDPTAAARMKRARRREREGLAAFRLDLPENKSIETLLAHGFLRAADAIDKDKVRVAMEKMVAHVIFSYGVTPKMVD